MGRWTGSLVLTALLLSPSPLAAQSRAEECLGVHPTITGTSKGEFISGTSGNDIIHGRGGDDVIDGRGGFDVICGGDGDDQVLGGGGLDVLVGGVGADVLHGDSGPDWLFDVDPTGSDIVLFAEPVDASTDVLNGNGGSDFLVGEGGDDRLDGGKGSDFVVATTNYAPTTINLSGGVMVSTYSGFDTLSGIENAFGTFWDDVIVGDAGENLLGGIFGADRVYGGDGSDILYSSIDGASLYGGTDQSTDTVWVSLLEEARIDLTTRTVRSLRHAEDVPDEIVDFENVIATPYDDVLVGDELPNVLGGVGGSDRILGGGGDDILLGDAPDYIRLFYKDGRKGGRDFLDGGAGNDTVDGGPLRDGCVNAEKKTSCEGEDVPEPAECPDSDPMCSLPIPPRLLASDHLGFLRALAVASPDVTLRELEWTARILERIF